MAVLIDPPLWPAHDALWSHLVSDTSYEELHAFAALVPLPRRGFDVDHYDVPDRLYARVIELGATPVDSRALVRRLRSSGLRVKGRDREALRPERRLEYLVTEWSGLFTLLGADAGRDQVELWDRLGASLLARWNEPHRRYHAQTHLEDVLLSLNLLATRGEYIAPETLLAAWFHDAVYTGATGTDEADSAHLAVTSLAAFDLSPTLTTRVADFIVATTPNVANDTSQVALAHLLDADISIFAAADSRYQRYTQSVREEYSHVPDPLFRRGRADILRGYLNAPNIYHSDVAHTLWEQRARQNLMREVASLEAPA